MEGAPYEPDLCLVGGKWKRGKTLSPRLEGAEADFILVTACAVSERLAPAGACVFSCMLSGAHRSVVRADLNGWFSPTCEIHNVWFSGFLAHGVVVF